MKTPSQKKVWDDIAEEWEKFKNEKPSESVLDFLKDKTGNVLDLGSGSGRHLVKIENGKMFLIDFSENMIKLAEKKSKKEKIPAEFLVVNPEKERLPFENNFFDSAISIAFLHCTHPEYHKKIIGEIYRVLKPSAEALIVVWNKDSKRFKNSPKEKFVGWRDKGKRYYYLFEEKEIHDLFENAGFEIKDKLISYVNIAFIVGKI